MSLRGGADFFLHELGAEGLAHEVVHAAGEAAFAVLVEKGRSGGAVAAPVAKAFLTELATGS